MGDLVRDAAEQEALRARHPLVADHDQVGVLLLGDVEDRVRWVAFAREGDAADAILDVAEETNADLIVVGNKGMTGAKRFLLGSVPNKVSHHAPCSVMIVQTT